MLSYRTELANRPPVPQDMQDEAMRAMAAQAPAKADNYFAALNMPAYQRQVADINLDYARKQRQMQQDNALRGLTAMASEEASYMPMRGSLLGRLAE